MIETSVKKELDPFRSIVTFHIENSYLVCTAKEMAGFYTKSSTKLKWIKDQL